MEIFTDMTQKTKNARVLVRHKRIRRFYKTHANYNLSDEYFECDDKKEEEATQIRKIDDVAHVLDELEFPEDLDEARREAKKMLEEEGKAGISRAEPWVDEPAEYSDVFLGHDSDEE